MNKQIDGMVRNWPPLRTNRRSHPRDMWRASLIGAIGSCLAPFFVGIMLLGASVIFESDPPTELYNAVWGLGFILMVSPAASLIAFVPALLLSVTALKTGFAGWLVAVAAGIAVATTIFSVVISIQGNPIVVGGISGALYGGLFWLIARLSTPQAFVAVKDAH